MFALTHWNLENQRFNVQESLNCLSCPLHRRTYPIKFVDKTYLRCTSFLCLSPYLNSLSLDSLPSIKNGDGSIQNHQTSGNLSRKVYVARSINQIDLALIPVEADGSRSNGDSSFFFLFEIVHGGISLFDIWVRIVNYFLEKGGLQRSKACVRLWWFFLHRYVRWCRCFWSWLGCRLSWWGAHFLQLCLASTPFLFWFCLELKWRSSLTF